MNSIERFLSLIFLIAGTSHLVAATPQTANPNDQDPFLPLAVHGDGAAVSLQDLGQDRYQFAVKAVSEAFAKRDKGQIDKIDFPEFGKAYAALNQLERIAGQLEILGEPAGPEFQRRSANAHKMSELGQTIGISSAAAPFMAKVRQTIANSAKARLNAIKRAEELAEKDNWEAAEAALYDILDKLAAFTVFLPPTEIIPIYEPFNNIRQRVTANMIRIRREASAKIYTERLEKMTPDLDSFLTDAKQAAQEVGASGSAMVEGESLAGPAAVLSFARRWEKLHAAIQRLDGVDMAARLKPENSPLHPVVTRFTTTFNLEASTALAAIIEADAMRVSVEEVVQLYPQYVQAVALLSARAADDRPSNILFAGLQKLAAKSPGFAQDAANYALATDELLRWRQRTAQGQARYQQSSFVSLNQKVQQATTNKSPYLALFQESQPEYPVPRIMGATPDFLPVASGQLLKQKVSAFGGRGLANGKSSVAMLNDRIYATYKNSPDDLQPHIAALEADLFVTEGSPPLSLRAAMAVESAKAGDFEAVGGQISGIHIEGYVTRLATLPDSVWLLLPLGGLHAHPPTNFPGDILNHAAVRCDLRPSWGQHRSFFAQLKSDAAK